MRKILVVTLFTFTFSLLPGLCEAQYTDLLDFNGTNGSQPLYGDLAVFGNKLYGTTSIGGAYNEGCIFSLDTGGSAYKDLLDFNRTNGEGPTGSVILSGGTLYGMASTGGAYGEGNIFSIDTDGSGFTDLLDFYASNYPQGANPWGSLILSGNVLFGMTRLGGATGHGVIFSVHTDGSGYKDMFEFNGTTGFYAIGSLIVSGNILFGMTQQGGIYNDGNIFSIDTDGGNFKDLFDFNGTNGYRPNASLVLSGNILYGTTQNGGATNTGIIFSIDTNGNNYTVLYDCNPSYYGEYPECSLTLSGKMLYGFGHNGGLNNWGCIFSMDTNGVKYTDLLDFDGYSNPKGGGSWGSLTLSGGALYGMTYYGGADSDGVVFKFRDTSSMTTSTQQLSVLNRKLPVYPNPSKGQFIIQSSVESGQSSVEIYNTLGEKVYYSFTTHNSQFTIDLSSKPSGIYFYRVLNNDGSVLGSGKLIIQK